MFDNIGNYGSITDLGRPQEVQETRREERISMAEVAQEQQQTHILAGISNQMAAANSNARAASEDRRWKGLSTQARGEAMNAEIAFFYILCYSGLIGIISHFMATSWMETFAWGLPVVMAARALRYPLRDTIQGFLAGVGAILACTTAVTLAALALAGLTIYMASVQSRPPMITLPAAAGVGAIIGAAIGSLLALLLLFTPGANRVR